MDERDSSIDRLLRRVHTGRDPVATEGCLDAETVALLADGELHGATRRAAEGHAAGCARCQAVLSAMVRTTLVERRAVPWLRRSLTILGPAAAAAALTVWFAVDRRMAREAVEPAREGQVSAGVERSATPGSGTIAPAPAASDPTAAPAPPEPVERMKRIEPRSGPAERTPPRAIDAIAADSASGRIRPTGPPAADALAAVGTAAPPVPPAPAVPAISESVMVPSAEAQLPAPSPAKPGSVGNASRGRAAGAPEARPAAAQPQARGLAAAPMLVEVSSDRHQVRWRIAAGRVVDRSPDNGKTWAPQVLPPTPPLTSGSAPSPTVCWLAGRAGTVLLTTDGSTWQRLTFPETGDIVAITATSARAAQVTMADGRVFETEDGGARWTLRP